MNGFTAPSSCPKCGGTMREGLTALNRELAQLSEGHPAIGTRMMLGAACSWWELRAPDKPGIADKVLTGEPRQIFAYRCDQCAFMELFAP